MAKRKAAKVFRKKAVDTRPIADAVMVEKSLGEFHGLMFRFSEAAQAANDRHAAAVSSYLHDQFCLVRAALGEFPAPQVLQPYPKLSDQSIAQGTVESAKAFEFEVPAELLSNIAYTHLNTLMENELSNCPRAEPTSISEAEAMLKLKHALAARANSVVIRVNWKS